MPYDHSFAFRLGWAVVAALISYPLLFWFLRSVKNVPLRFNVAVMAAFTVAGLLPLEFIGYMTSTSESHIATIQLFAQVQQFAVDRTLLCTADVTKVEPGRIAEAKQHLAASVDTWSNWEQSKEITSAEWLKVDDPCVWHWDLKRDGPELQRESAEKWAIRWLAAAFATGVIGLWALYELVVSRVRQDLREAQVIDAVELKGSKDIVLAALICGIAFLPFSLLWLRLFKSPTKPSANPRTSAQ